MGKDYEQAIHKEKKIILNKQIKRCSNSLVSREMQIKTTVKYSLNTPQIDKNKNLTIL